MALLFGASPTPNLEVETGYPAILILSRRTMHLLICRADENNMAGIYCAARQNGQQAKAGTIILWNLTPSNATDSMQQPVESRN